MDWSAYFQMMIDWKKLPAYKAEPRIDSLIGFFLPKILEDFLYIKDVEIIPEFPIRLGTIYPDKDGTIYADRSYKVDFLAVDFNKNIYFIEFKTDSGSRRPEQDKYLRLSCDKGFKKIIEGLMRIVTVSSYKTKYQHLLSKLTFMNILDHQGNTVVSNDSINIIYVQPHKTAESDNIISFSEIAEWLEKRENNTDFEINLAMALRQWQND